MANVAFPAAEEITQSVDQDKRRLISQLIKHISRVVQKLVALLFQHFFIIIVRSFCYYFNFGFK